MFSPSVNNCKPTESTLKFAVTDGMVKVKPVKPEVSLNVEKLVQRLRKPIGENDKLIDGHEASLMEKRTVLEQLKQELMVAGGDRHGRVPAHHHHQAPAGRFESARAAPVSAQRTRSC